MFARTKSYRFLRSSQALLMTLLPFLLQWSLGGYVASSAVSLWAVVAVFATLFFFSVDASIPWFVAFAGLTVISGLIDPLLARDAAPIPDPIRLAFFVLNVLGVRSPHTCCSSTRCAPATRPSPDRRGSC